MVLLTSLWIAATLSLTASNTQAQPSSLAAASNASKIYLSNPNGQNKKVILRGEGIDALQVELAWSPDSRQLAYLAYTDQKCFGKEKNLFTVNADGTAIQQLTNSDDEIALPVWSPDGKKLAYTKKFGAGCEPFTGGPFGMYLINSDGSGNRRIDSDGRSFAPSFSPDGKTIAFGHLESMKYVRNSIYSMGLDGLNKKPLTKVRREKNGSFTSQGLYYWSPNGLNISYTQRSEGKSWLYVMRNDGSHKKRVMRAKFFITPASWSPDGMWIAYSNDRSLYVMRANGTKRRRLAFVSRSPMLSWSPDGKRFVYEAGHNIYVIGKNGHGKKRISRGTCVRHTNPVWSPDGKWIAYASESYRYKGCSRKR